MTDKPSLASCSSASSSWCAAPPNTRISHAIGQRHRDRHALIRPVRRFEQYEQFDRLIARITEMRRGNATAQDIADRLNIEGWKPPKKQAFNAPMIRRLLQRRGLGTRRPIWSGNASPGQRRRDDNPGARHAAPRPSPDRLRLAAQRQTQGPLGKGRHPAHLAVTRLRPQHEPAIESRHDNTIERVWLDLRERYLSHRLLAQYDAVVEACCTAWNALTAETGRIRSLTTYPYLEQVSP